jgi:hypothetical protein
MEHQYVLISCGFKSDFSSFFILNEQCMLIYMQTRVSIVLRKHALVFCFFPYRKRHYKYLDWLFQLVL